MSRARSALPEAGTAAAGGRRRQGRAWRPRRRGCVEVLSPDKKHAVFIRDSNLWVRDVATNKETQLTTDGIKDFGYATDNAGWTSSDRPIVLWSPDSKRIATFQQDQRGVGEMYLVETKVGHPTLRAWKYPLPGDEVVTTIQRVIIDVDDPRVVRLQMPPDQHRSTLCDDVACRGGEWADVQWGTDGSSWPSFRPRAITSRKSCGLPTRRPARSATFSKRRSPRSSNPATGASTGATCRESKEFIWFCERDNWGHLYLYDSETGKLKNQITTGEGNVTQLLRVDEKNRSCTSWAWAARRAAIRTSSTSTASASTARTSRCSRRRTATTK